MKDLYLCVLMDVLMSMWERAADYIECVSMSMWEHTADYIECVSMSMWEHAAAI